METTKYVVARSFSKKFQPVPFESEDFHAFHQYVFDVTPTQKQIDDKSEELWQLCKAEVIDAIKERMKDIKKAREEDKEGPF